MAYKTLRPILLVLLLIPNGLWAAENTEAIDEKVYETIIQESIATYPGSCPCPYSKAKNGSRCGKRSAYSRPGGASPVCYKSDVSDEMVRRYLDRHGVLHHIKW